MGTNKRNIIALWSATGVHGVPFEKPKYCGLAARALEDFICQHHDAGLNLGDQVRVVHAEAVKGSPQPDQGRVRFQRIAKQVLYPLGLFFIVRPGGNETARRVTVQLPKGADLDRAVELLSADPVVSVPQRPKPKVAIQTAARPQVAPTVAPSVAATGVDPSDYGALAKALRELFIGFTARLRGLRAEAADLEGQLSVPIEELRAAAAARAYLAQIEDIGLRERLVATADAVLLERAVSIEVGQARLVDLNLDIGNVEADRGLLVECVEGITKED